LGSSETPKTFASGIAKLAARRVKADRLHDPSAARDDSFPVRRARDKPKRLG
jgi:hypothetical protein